MARIINLNVCLWIFLYEIPKIRSIRLRSKHNPAHLSKDFNPPECLENLKRTMVPPNMIFDSIRQLPPLGERHLDPPCYTEPHALLANQSVDPVLLDRYLLTHSHNNARYIPLDFLRILNPTHSEISMLRMLHGVLFDCASQALPVVGLVQGDSSFAPDGSHFYVVVVLPTQREVHFLGRQTTSFYLEQGTTNWGQWEVSKSWKVSAFIMVGVHEDISFSTRIGLGMDMTVVPLPVK